LGCIGRRQEFLAPATEAESDETPLSCAANRLDDARAGQGEKVFGKHPAQRPVALGERCLLASTPVGDTVLLDRI
jgi:DNA modification methylase